MISSFLKDSRIRYLFVGGSSAVIEYGLFYLLIMISLPAGYSNALSFLVGFIYTFTLHNVWSFAGNHNKGIKTRLVSYAILAVINTLATSAIVVLQVDILGINPLIAKVVCMVLVVVWNYIILNKVIFKRNDKS